MKTCPRCAESIQDAAVVCRHCNRNIESSAAMESLHTFVGVPTVGRVLAILGLGAAAVVIFALVRHQAGTLATSASAQPAPVLPPPPPPPLTVPVYNGQPVEIKAASYEYYLFTVPERKCYLEGHVEGIAGGNKDFEGFIMASDDFKNWSTSHFANGVASGRVAAWTPKVSIAPGMHYLVVSNAFSIVSSKVVTVEANVVCP